MSPPQIQTSTNTHTSMTANSKHSQKHIMLSTARFLVQASNGNWILARALLDSGSNTNFMSARLAHELKLKLTDAFMTVSGVNNHTVIARNRTEAIIHSKNSNFSMQIPCLVLNDITGNIPSQRVYIDRQQIRSDIVLADPQFDEPAEIDLLVGADVFMLLFMVRKFSFQTALSS